MVTDEIKCIISLYYSNLDNWESQIEDDSCSLDLGLVQLLLMLESVFDVIHFKCKEHTTGTSIIPGFENEHFYYMVTYPVGAGESCVRLLNREKLFHEGLMDTSFLQSVRKLNDVAQRHLVFSNWIVNHINGYNILQKRKELAYHLLFDDRNGIGLVRYTFQKLQRLIISVCIDKKSDPEIVLEGMNKDFDQMQSLLSIFSEIGADLENRIFSAVNCSDYSFENEKNILEDWLSVRLARSWEEQNIFDFIFFDISEGMLKKEKALLRLICDTADIFGVRHTLRRTYEMVKEESGYVPLEILYLDSKIREVDELPKDQYSSWGYSILMDMKAVENYL